VRYDSQNRSYWASALRIVKPVILLFIGCCIVGFTLAPLPASPPIETKAEAVIAASSYIDKIACKFGTRKIEVQERDTYFEISIIDVASAGRKNCDAEVVIVCKADGVLVKKGAAAKCAVKHDAAITSASTDIATHSMAASGRLQPFGHFDVKWRLLTRSGHSGLSASMKHGRVLVCRTPTRMRVM
jgi:hypothetical protein